MKISKSVLAVMLIILVAGLAWGEKYTYGGDLAGGHEVKPVKTKDGKNKYVPNQIIIKYKKKAADKIAEQRLQGVDTKSLKISSNLDALNKKHALRDINPIFKSHKKFVERNKGLLKKKFKNLTKKEKHLVQRLKRAPKNAKVPSLDRIYLLHVDLNEGESLEDAAAGYNQDPDVEYAELNYIVSTNVIPNESQYGLYSLQWSLENTGQIYPTSGSHNAPPGTVDADIDASAAWNTTTGSSNIIVAVVDTGVDYNHRDLQGNIWTNDIEMNGLDGVDDDMNGFVDDKYGYHFAGNGLFPDSDPIDDHGHGTHCAGTIAAKGNNSLDVVGVCWDAKIMAVKFLSSGGSGYLLDGELAVQYAIENGADVISNSWGGGGYYQSMQDLINYAYSQGIIFVAAAGNKNSSDIYYPAGFDNVISVAATDSNDDKATFSNYGDWVDVAAPGVDILSLRADGTSLGTVYDDYTTVLSGTSMACPHVSGVCAAMLSVNPLLSPDEVLDILSNSGDTLLDTSICYSDSRLNFNSALSGTITPLGTIYLEHDSYSCSSEILIKVFDSDLRGLDNVSVAVSTDGNDLETITLYEDSSILGFFTNTIYTSSNPVSVEDGVLEVSDGDIITATYQDADDGTGNSSVATDTAVTDCQAPIISNISIQPKGPRPVIFFDTNEPAYGTVRCGTVPGGPYDIIVTESSVTNNHSIKLANISQATTYYYIIEATDKAGNNTIDDNSGQCYTFTSTSAGDIYVPSEASTISDAIEQSWDGGTVWLADGTYSGNGNRDIDVVDKMITIASENGPDSCIIDCQGTYTDYHRGFKYIGTEGKSSKLKGIKIINGYHYEGGALFIYQGSITVEDCIFEDNNSEYDGGSVHNEASNSKFVNCIFKSNICSGKAFSSGGAVSNYLANPEFISCSFISNRAINLGGGFYSNSGNPSFNNCEFLNNRGRRGGGAYIGSYSEGLSKIEDCVFYNNSSNEIGGALVNESGPETIIDSCVFENNSTVDRGGAIFNSGFQGTTKISNCLLMNNTAAKGGAYSGVFTRSEISNCLFYGNSGTYGGAIFSYSPGSIADRNNVSVYNSTFSQNDATYGSFMAIDPNNFFVEIENCVVWDGTDSIWTSNQVGTIEINYTNIQGGYQGEGNINIDPLFVDSLNNDFHLDLNSPCINAGDPNYIPELNEVDMDWDIRILAGRLDMGYDEHAGIYNFQKDKWYPTIQSAIDDANELDVIELSPGEYKGIGNGNINFSGKAITLTSINPDDPCVVASTVIDANGSGDTVIFETSENANSVLTGFTVTGGSMNGVYCNEASPTISKCVISGNIFGLTLDDSSASIDSCRIDNNSGYGMICSGGSPEITNCLIFEQYAGIGIEWESSPTITNTTIADNTSYGITISNAYGGTPTIVNCILWGNSDDLDGFTAAYSCIEDGDAGTGNISSDPCFVDEANDDYHLSISSPCIDSGDPNKLLNMNEFDFDGDLRVLGGRVDMGFDEVRTIFNNRSNKRYLTIQAAIDDAVELDTIVLSLGKYTGDGNRDIDFAGKGITLQGMNPDDWSTVEATIIDCQGSIIDPHIAFNFISGEGTDSVIEGITIKNGYATSYTYNGDTLVPAGAILCDNSSPTISKCSIINNNGSTGIAGAIACLGGSSPNISNCIISDNTGGRTGGIFCMDSSEAVISNCVIKSNSGSTGGILCMSSDATIVNCLISNNNGNGVGGIENSLSSLIVQGNTIAGNFGDITGGYFEFLGTSTITNCIIWGNSNLYGISEYLNLYSTTTLSYNDIRDCGGSGPNWDTSLGTDGGGNIDVDPYFVDADNGDYHLSSNSPCIDAGDNDGVDVSVDIDGDDRKIDDPNTTDTGNGTAPIVDMGADEYDPN